MNQAIRLVAWLLLLWLCLMGRTFAVEIVVEGANPYVVNTQATPRKPAVSTSQEPETSSAQQALPAAGAFAELSADAQPTPWPGVAAMLNELKPQHDEVLVDFGCGRDARLLIAACNYFGVEKAIGIEIDPDAAMCARRYVETHGLEGRITIIDGDSTKLNVEADIGVAYLWPETLSALRPKIQKLDRFVCYGFAVPGLSMAAKAVGVLTPGAPSGVIYSWPRPEPARVQVPITKSVRQTVRLPRGSYCQVCGRHCSNPMAHRLQQQIVGYKSILSGGPASPPARATVAPSSTVRASATSSGHWEQRRVCVNGRCRIVTTWVPN